ncbi:MAG: SRPBCC family protein [Flavobacteriales bacterium]|nr:SRPBCC family protein [Flavobacteriales bacterium]
MKYQCSVDIDAPIHLVVNLWKDESLFGKWQDGFQSTELLEGLADEVGAKSKIIYQQGNKRLELKETIISNSLPEEKTARYDHVHMSNTQTSRFESLSENRTRYISEVDYISFHSLLPKLMAKLFPSMFKKQSQKWMNQFKGFVETHIKSNEP